MSPGEMVVTLHPGCKRGGEYNNEVHCHDKKSLQRIILQALEYPEPGSNRHGIATTGV